MTPALELERSTASTSRRRCSYRGCEATGDGHEFSTTDYCSEVCKHRAEGREFLNQLIHDHRYCGTCFTKLKEVTGVPPEWYWSGFQKETAIAFTGYQFRLPEADIGEIELDINGETKISTGTVCGRCGSTNHSDPIPWGENRHLIEAAGRLVDAAELEELGDLNHRELMHTLIETRDIELAVGRSLE